MKVVRYREIEIPERCGGRSFGSMRRLTLLLIASFCVGLLTLTGAAQSLVSAPPHTVGMSASRLAHIDAAVAAEIRNKKLPGAVVLVGRKGKLVYRKAFGSSSLSPSVEPMRVDTIFDAASLTKPVATATSIMLLVEQGKLRLNDTVGIYISDIDEAQAKRITIQQLLTHVSGYAPDFDLKEKWTGRDGMLAALKTEKLRSAPGTRFVYSDIGFIVLGEIIHRISGKPLEQFAAENIFDQLGMADSGFRLLNDKVSDTQGAAAAQHLKRIAPTENIRGQNSYLGATFNGDEATGNRMLRGQVHDPTAYRMGGVAGHAGLFSTADDLARYCQMLLNGGVYGGRRIMSAQSVSRMTAPVVVSEMGDSRGLGWDISTSFSSNRGDLFPLGSFGHTGFTGTSVWIDRVSQTFVIFLSNRVHPDGKGDVTPLRARVSTIAMSAVEDTPIEMVRLAEGTYASQVAAQVARFKENLARQQATASNSVGRAPVNTTVLNGIDVLERNGFKELQGLKIALVTNHTGRNLAGKQTIDILKAAPNVQLVALFAPEHGIRGELDVEGIKDSEDERTGLPIYSLYGETRRPKPEHLRGVDAIIYDIQDIGTRFYTYTATLKNVLEEAAKAKKPVFVLDRPNPINGIAIEGPLAEESKLSFIAAHTTPVRYGMTIGELGQMMNAERKIGADLRVIKMDGWSRSMWFDETGQTWVNPSPNMRSLTEATLYPGIGLLETTNVSVGRGTDTPFEIVGAPWIDGRRLASYLNEKALKGVRFIPVRFKPDTSVFKNEECGGVNILVTDRNALNSVRVGLEIAAALRKLYPAEWQVDRFLRLLVNEQILDRVKSGEQPADIERSYAASTSEFIRRQASYLLYK